MAIRCITNGNRLIGSVIQPMSLTLLFIIMLFFIVIGALGIDLFKSISKNKSDTCQKYVFKDTYAQVENQLVFIILIVLGIICFFLALLGYNKNIKDLSKWTEYIFPSILVMFSIIFFGVSKIFYDNAEAEKNKNANGTVLPNVPENIINWCLDTTDSDKYMALVVIFVIGLVVIFAYLMDFISNVCLFY